MMYTMFVFLFPGGPAFTRQQSALRPDLGPVDAGPERGNRGNQGPDALSAERSHNKGRRKRDGSQHRGHQHARTVQAQ